MKTNPLKIVKTTHRPVDISALLRADIAQRDWAAVHVAGDKREPLFIPDVLKRIWRG